MTSMQPIVPRLRKNGRLAKPSLWHFEEEALIRAAYNERRASHTPAIRFGRGPEDLRHDIVGGERAAAFLGCGPRSLYQLRTYSDLPHYVAREGQRRVIVYFLSELAGWLERRQHGRLYR